MIAPGRAAGAGLLAASVTLLVLLLAPLVLNADGFLEAVHNGVTKYFPTGLLDLGIGTFGPYAKGLLFVGVCAGVLGAGALTGWLLARYAGLGMGGPIYETVFVSGLTFLLAEVVVLPVFQVGLFGSDFRGPVLPLHAPLAIGCVAFGVMLTARVRRPTAARVDAETSPARSGLFGRRAFLGRAVAILGFGALGGSGLTVAARVIAAGSTNQVARGASPSDGFGPTPAITPLDHFYVVAKDVFPLAVDVSAWRLQVSGLVDRPLSLSLDQIRAMPAVEGYRTFQCISSRVTTYDQLIGNQRFAGVRVVDVLTAAGVRPSATFVLWRAADGYTESLPLAVARDPRTWLAYEMGPAGTLLRPEHGAPLRVIIAGRYGMKQPKFLTGIELADHDEDGYWEQRGWDKTAAVRVYSRIDQPGDQDQVRANLPFAMYGIANAGDRGISRVEVSADDGQTWQAAELETGDPAVSALTWVRWRALSVAVPRVGAATLAVRATDGQGNVQDAEPRPPLPSGATGYHRVPIVAT